MPDEAISSSHLIVNKRDPYLVASDGILVALGDSSNPSFISSFAPTQCLFA